MADVTYGDDLATLEALQGKAATSVENGGSPFTFSSSRSETRHFPTVARSRSAGRGMRPERETAAAPDAEKDRTKTGRKGLHFGSTKVYDWRVGRAREFRWGGRRSRPAALAVSLLAASLALAEGAGAQAVAPAAPTVAIRVALGQVAQQTSQTLQAAGAQATAVQVQPTNVAAPVAVASPGSSTVVAQGNVAGAGASSANSSSTKQSAGQSKGGGAAPASPSPGTAGGHAPEPASGGPAQASGQASKTSQNAGAQATTVQAQPINVAVPIMIGSPGGSIVIKQTNAASSGATATNSSSTTQTAGQSGSGSAGALPGKPGAAAPASSAPATGGSLPGWSQSVLTPTGSGMTWIWIWNWTINVTMPSVQRPVVSSWMLPGEEARPATPARAERRRPSSAQRDAGLSTQTTGGSGPDVASAVPAMANGVSSGIVHRPITAREPALEPFVARPLPPLSAPSAGSGFVPAGLIFGALAFLALYLGSLGLLFGRLSLAWAPWRHQAYFAPLQRPG